MEAKKQKSNLFGWGLILAYSFVAIFSFFRIYSFHLYPVYSSEEQKPLAMDQLASLNYLTSTPNISNVPPLECDWDTASYLIFSDNIEPLIYYSHLTSILIFLTLFIFTFSRFKNGQGQGFKVMILAYVSWLFCDLVLWANESIDHIMFFWTILTIIEPLIFIGAYVFFVQFTNNSDKGLRNFDKILISLLLLPTLITAILGISVVGFDYTTCDRNVWEGVGVYYGYFVEFLLLVLVIIRTIIELRGEKIKGHRAKLLLTSSGVCLLFLSFLGSNFIATYTDTYTTSQLGHIAVPIFAIFIAYITIKYESVEPRVLSVDMLIAAMGILLFSLLFVENAQYQLYANIAAFIIAIPLGVLLVGTIRKEVTLRKEVERLATNLMDANARLKELDTAKSEFISIASHQLRTPLTAIKGYVSLLLEGSYGVLNRDAVDVLNKVYSVNDRLAHLVEDLLNVSRIEAGRIQYNFQATQLADILSELNDMFSMPAKNKGLLLTLNLPKPNLPMLMADPNKIKEICSNLIDNAIKYTPSGSVTITLAQIGPNARITIADTGIGIKPEDKEHLFTKFVRSKETSRMVVGGAGLGLFVGKSFVLAHKGRIWADSEGAGKGSKFIIEIPIVNTALQAGTVEK